MDDTAANQYISNYIVLCLCMCRWLRSTTRTKARVYSGSEQTSPMLRRLEDLLFFRDRLRLRSRLRFPMRRRTSMKLCTLTGRRSGLFRFLAAGVMATVAASAAAHHSFAMFDPQHPVQLEGTVKSW